MLTQGMIPKERTNLVITKALFSDRSQSMHRDERVIIHRHGSVWYAFHFITIILYDYAFSKLQSN